MSIMISSLSVSSPSFHEASKALALFLEPLARLLGTQLHAAEGVSSLDMEAKRGRLPNLRIRMCQELQPQRAYHEDEHMSISR